MNHPRSRRELLRDAMASAATIAIPGIPTAPHPAYRQAKPLKVAVLGAGLAGLVAAHELAKQGHQVTVLEARKRAGGRVETLHKPFSDNLYAEAGALFIPDNHAHTLKYAREFSLPLVPVPPRAFAEMFFVRGQRIISRGAPEDWPLDLKPEEKQMGRQGMWDLYIGSAAARILKEGDPAARIWPPESLKYLDQMTMAEFLRRQGASPDAIALLRLGYLDLHGEGVEAASALTLLRECALRLKEQRVYHIRGGNDQLPRAFADKLAEAIRYECEVTQLYQTGESVAVTFTRAGKPETLTADRVVCALPFTTLRKIAIRPAFSTEKAKAVAELPYTSVSRAFLQMRSKYWAAAGLPAMTNADTPLMWSWEPTFDQPGPRGILEVHSAGPAARKLSGQREPDRIESSLDLLEPVYPGAHDHYERGTTKCWDDEEWSRGAYSWMRPGQITTLGPHIARPEGRIHFAGEHTSARPGWMQGALDSGLRAAREITAAP